MVIGGRRWRRQDPDLPDDVRDELLSHLGRGRSGVRTAKASGGADGARRGPQPGEPGQARSGRARRPVVGPVAGREARPLGRSARRPARPRRLTASAVVRHPSGSDVGTDLRRRPNRGQTKRPERDKVAETDCSPGRHRGVDQRQPSGAVRRRWMCPCDLTDRPSDRSPPTRARWWPALAAVLLVPLAGPATAAPGPDRRARRRGSAERPPSSATAAPAATAPSTRWRRTASRSGSAPTSSSPTSSPPRTASSSPATRTRSAAPPTSPTTRSSPTATRPRRSTARRTRAGSPRTSPSPS